VRDLLRVGEAEDAADPVARVLVGDLVVGQQLQLGELLLQGHLLQEGVGAFLDAGIGPAARRPQHGVVRRAGRGDHAADGE
jgi:hypothetical protein